MAASDFVHAPPSPLASATGASASSSNNSSNNNNNTSALNVRAVQVHNSKDSASAVARKSASLNEPQHRQHSDGSENLEQSCTHRRRRKRDVFLALFKHSPKQTSATTTASAADTASASSDSIVSRVPVEIPIGYTNAEHKGCLVSGRRVAYSRHMHQGRKTALAKKLECALPEDEQVLEFPATQLQLEQVRKQKREQAELEAAQNRSAVARSLFF